MIRRAVLDDVMGITDCVNQAYRHYVQRIGMQPAPMNQDYTEVLLNNTVYVVEASQIIGVLVVKVLPPRLFIENIAVLPDFQGRGIGKQLLDMSERVAKTNQCCVLSLYTNTAMTENISWYQSIGFQTTETKVVDGYHRVYMEKQILES